MERAITRRHYLLLLLVAVLVACWNSSEVFAQRPGPERNLGADGPNLPPPRTKKPTTLDLIERRLPEGAAMLVHIIGGGQVEPGKGWFIKGGRAATRFPWATVVARLDANHDGFISPKEFAGSPDDFRRLDRDRDAAVTPTDFEFPDNALEKCRSRMIMSFADRDHDGRISPEECANMTFLAYRDKVTLHLYFANSLDDLENRYQTSVKEGHSFLTITDLRETIDVRAKLKGHPGVPNPDGDFEKGAKPSLVEALLHRDIGVLRAGPALGDPAPGFALPNDDGRGEVALKSLLGRKPVVLIFGNYSSPGFRVEAGSLEKLYRRYRDRVEFLFVYVREEHPSNGWVSRENSKLNVAVAQPADDKLRAATAQRARKKLGLTLPTVVDHVDDRVGILYSAMPDRLYLLDPRGLIAYKGGRGPFGFKPDELEQSLILLLQAEQATPPAGSPVVSEGR